MIKRKNGQVSLELATAFICIFLLLLAAVKLSVWLVGQMTVRQENFESTRPNTGGIVSEPTQKLDFF